MKAFNWDRILEVIVENIGGFVPVLLAALVVLLVGWIAALFISRLVRRGVRKLGLNERLGRWLDGPAGAVDVERGASRVVYWLLMILVSVAFFQTLGLTLITEPLNNLLNQVFAFLPQILSAAILLLIAWVLANILRVRVRHLLNATRFEERLGPPEGEERRAPLSQTIGDVAYWLVFLLFLPAVVGALALEGLLGPVQSMLNNVLTFLPNILAAALILMSGWFLSRGLRRIITNLLASAGADRISERVGLVAGVGEQRLSSLIGLILYVLVLIPVLIAALNALQLESITEPTSNMLDSILQAIPNIFAAALVIAIAFVVGRLVAGQSGMSGFDGGVDDDFLNGQNGDDVLAGRHGNDTINGDTGDDVVNGGDGHDTINGGSGDDILGGHDGNDRINAGAGNDTLVGGDGDDAINGSAGDDSALGGDGQDSLLGGIGDDTLDGGVDNDTISGQGGNDVIAGRHGDDNLDGNEGDDIINGGDGHDLITGGSGDDLLGGHDGDDRINAGGGADTLVGGDGPVSYTHLTLPTILLV